MKVNLRKHVGTRRMIRITRRTPCEPTVYGYLLGLSKTLALLHRFDDFEPDGYSVLRVEDVVKVRSAAHERCWDYILAAEKLLAGLKFRQPIDLTSMRSAIETIGQCYDHMIIECEDEEEDVEDFYIGSLVATSDDGIRFRHFDAQGYWERRPSTIVLADISHVQFDTPYANIFSKYTREKVRQQKRRWATRHGLPVAVGRRPYGAGCAGVARQ